MMKNKFFSIELNNKTGNVSSIVINGDPDKMNWCSMTKEWGELVNVNRLNAVETEENRLISFKEDKNSSTSVFSNGKIKVTVTRIFTDEGAFRESYTFENILDADVFLQRGEIGIYTPFCDEWKSADISLKQCSNTHVWCGETEAWINSLKQGSSEHNIGVVITEGSVNAYSIDRENQTLQSNTRGNILIHPAERDLLINEKFTLSWEIFVHKNNNNFFDKLKKYGKICPTAEHYTVFDGEQAVFSFESDAKEIRIIRDGEDIPFTREGGIIKVSAKPKPGDNKFYIHADEKTTHISIYAVSGFEELLERRINFIVDNQQYFREGSCVDGAYLIYDNKEKRMVYDKQITDHNACRERLGMSLLIARYLQTHENKKFYDSLMKCVEFIKREILNTETGEVYNSEGKDSNTVRLYNAPWMITLMCELYNLTGDEKYLETAYKSVKFYYTQGGAKFYPNGLSMKLTVDALKKGGKDKYADEVTELFKIHTYNMIKTGLSYPPMECIFEQTIVTPAVTYICEMGLILEDDAYKDYVQSHLEVLERFNGMQPDYRTNGMPIRYWDDYWFGKAELFADTLHYWSCLTARSWNVYYQLSQDAKYRKMAEDCVRNCLCLFKEDGTASCAYVLPFKVDGHDGDFYDEWANDQDFALYFALTMF